MSSTYAISGGDTTILIATPVKNGLALSVEVISDSALDAPIQLKLQESNGDDATLSNDLPELPITTNSGADSNLLETKSFNTINLFLDIQVLTATLGTITFTFKQRNG